MSKKRGNTSGKRGQKADQVDGQMELFSTAPSPTTVEKKGPSAGDLIESLVREGMSQAKIARELDRDPSLVSQILRGKKSGRSFVDALTELVKTGEVKTPPARARTKTGALRRVRSKLTEPLKKGQKAPTKIPEERKKPRKKPRAGLPKLPKFRPAKVVEKKVEGIFKQVRVTAGSDPKQSSQEIVGQVRKLAQSQRWGTKRMRIEVTTKNGGKIVLGDKGGWKASTMLGAIREHNGDFAAAAAAHGHTYEMDLEDAEIESVNFRMW